MQEEDRAIPHAYPMIPNIDFGPQGRLYDQHFGEALSPQDLLCPTLYHGYYVRPRVSSAGSARSTRGLSEVRADADVYRALLDVSQFTPGELAVDCVDNLVRVRGEHAQRPDAHGFVSRTFTRLYLLPPGAVAHALRARVTHDGLLEITVPLDQTAAAGVVVRAVTVERDEEEEEEELGSQRSVVKHCDNHRSTPTHMGLKVP
uniref:Heat shock protein beta-2 n=1 Tax=Petromyzon marinus TaxID=7757 RepID=A0AAJ7UB94_PETMA|nr:heat shock protein beta-2 [Petromyzon marinus]